MRILSLDSSATSASVCVYDVAENKTIGEFFINNKLTHSQTLAPMISSLLNSCNLDFTDIDYYAVNTGPGSFTGIRIGVSIVKGLAMPQSKPCVDISTLESMAYNFIDCDAVVCACMDARRNQVYNALFEVSNGVVKRLCDDRAISIESLYDELKRLDRNVVLVGDGANLCFSLKPEDFDVTLACESRRYQRASSVALCAIAKINNNVITNAQKLMPGYLRPSQAERERINKEKEC